MRAQNILETIGNTPTIRVNRLFRDIAPNAEVWIKSERANPGASIKDRIALSMIEAAEASGELKRGGTIVEPTSGNTGIGLAMVAAVKGYPLILVMPESMSIERRRLMLAYGARFELTPREKGMPGSIERAKQLVAETPGAWMPQQFDNPANIDVHVRTTAQEVLRDFPEGFRRGDHRRRYRRTYHRDGSGIKAEVAAVESVRGRAGSVAGDLRRQAVAASDSGYRCRLHSKKPENRAARRSDPG